MGEVARVDLAGLRALAEQATPGPWQEEHEDGRPIVVHRLSTYGRIVADELKDADAAFIAACDPQTVLALVEAVEAARNPHLALLERHPKADEEANQKMYLSAESLRAALAPFEDSR